MKRKGFFSRGDSTIVIHARDPADPKYADDDRVDAGYGPPLILFLMNKLHRVLIGRYYTGVKNLM